MTAERQENTGSTLSGVRRFYYGGQAVIEGVMIRGQRFSSVAVRRPDGRIGTKVTPLNSAYTGRIRRIPLIRGLLVLVEMLVLGTKALMYSANVALEEEGKEMGRWSTGLMIAVSLTFTIAVFFVLPLFAVHLLDQVLQAGAVGDLISNLVEGLIRLGLFLAYIWGIGFMRDIRRVFEYHGAEHMAVKTFEAQEPLEVDNVRKYSTAHPRCGTAFLLVVMVVAIVVFAFMGRPDIYLRILSRIVFIPVIAGVSYEIIRFSGGHQNNPLVRFIVAPSLLLQALTTRRPDDEQIEVAITAMNAAIAADEGRELEKPQETEA